MSLIDQVRADIEQITTNSDEWAVEMTFTSPEGETATVNGLHTKHHMGYDPDGRPVNTKNAHVSVYETALTDLDYPVRNSAGEVHLDGHRVTVKDSTGEDKTYLIQQWMPDETVGFIVCILSTFELP